MQHPRSPNIAELGLALFSSCANINRLEIIDVTSSGNRFLLFGACRNGLSYTRYMDYRGYSHMYEDVASIYIGHEDMVNDRRNVTYLVHDWFYMEDPGLNDDNIEHVLMDNMRDVVRTMLRRLYTTGAYPPDHLRFLETRPSQVLEIRVWCKTAEADCITPGWVRYLQGSIWFELGLLERNPPPWWDGDYRGRITVVDNAAHPVTDIVIQLVESEDGSISCLNLAGEEVLSVPRNTDAQKLRPELARIQGVSPHSLHLVNERGELLTPPNANFSIPPPSDNFRRIRVP